MNERESFVTRWSRRKRANAQENATPSESAAPAASAGEAAAKAPPDGAEALASPLASPPANSPRSDAGELALPELPPIESIVAQTDVRAFLAPGVPPELTRAALRRAWSADPKIRDFVGLSENAWDFNDPTAMPGFGPLEITDELRREIARMIGRSLGETEPEVSASVPHDRAEARPESPSAPAASEALSPLAGAALPAAEQHTVGRPARDADSGPSAADPLERRQLAANRRHGGALPE